MKKRTLFLIFFTVLLGCTIQAQNVDIENIINKAALQRALTQRMAKNYMLIGIGINVEEATKELDKATTTFNENLHEIIFFDKTKNSEQAINKVNELWTRFRVFVNEKPSIEGAPQIILSSTQLMLACHKVVESLAESSTTAKSEKLQLIARCGLQRRNSQRMAMLYAAKYWGVHYSVDKELNETIEIFEKTLDFLLKNQTNTPEIEKILKFHRGEWIYLRKTFDTTDSLKPEQVISSTKLIFKDFDVLTAMYEKINL